MTTTEFRKHLLSQFPGSRLELITADIETQMRRDYSWLPADYFTFLREVGWRGIGDSEYMIYSGPIEANEFFDSEDGLKDVVLIGDDFSEHHEAYANRGNGCVFGTVSKESREYEPHSEATFMDFLLSWFGATS